MSTKMQRTDAVLNTSNKRRKDFWFTEDALDADNFSAARALAEHASNFGKKDEVHVWLDVSTAQRDLSQPAYTFPSAMTGTNKGFMGNEHDFYTSNIEAIDKDTLLCQEFDTHALLAVMQKYAAPDIQFHVILGKPTQQLLWDQIVPRTYAAIDFENGELSVSSEYAQRIRDLDGDVVTKTNAKGKNEYDRENDDAEKRRARHRAYIEKKNQQFPPLPPTATVEDFVAQCGQDVVFVLCAPLTTAALALEQVDATKVKQVVGELTTLRPSDNVVGAQFNEALDPAAAERVYVRLNAMGITPFVTPTQCFNVKDEYVELKAVRKIMQEIQHSLPAKGDTNFISQYQAFWNVVKRGQQAIFDPLCILYLHDKTAFSGVVDLHVSVGTQNITVNVLIPDKLDKTKVTRYYDNLYLSRVTHCPIPSRSPPTPKK
jgi:hypothetical protein